MDDFYSVERIVERKAEPTGMDIPGFKAGGAPASVRNIPPHGNSVVTWHSGLPVVWSKLGEGETAHRRIDLFLKRMLDIAGSLAALVVLAPLLGLVAVAIKISGPGPILFRQSREGLNGRQFNVYKFRSMRTENCDADGIAYTRKNDARVTMVGRFIRKTSIDELPQLFNVLAGDMSLVGPRPHVPGMLAAGRDYRTLVPYYDERLKMRPGITGWAQANGYRGLATNRHRAQARVDHDIAYIQNFSIWLDLKIILKTLVREFLTGSGH